MDTNTHTQTNTHTHKSRYSLCAYFWTGTLISQRLLYVSSKYKSDETWQNLVLKCKGFDLHRIHNIHINETYCCVKMPWNIMSHLRNYSNIWIWEFKQSVVLLHTDFPSQPQQKTSPVREVLGALNRYNDRTDVHIALWFVVRSRPYRLSKCLCISTLCHKRLLCTYHLSSVELGLREHCAWAVYVVCCCSFCSRSEYEHR